MSVVGSIVVSDDYSWGPSVVLAHYWHYAKEINHTEAEAGFKVW